VGGVGGGDDGAGDAWVFLRGVLGGEEDGQAVFRGALGRLDVRFDDRGEVRARVIRDLARVAQADEAGAVDDEGQGCPLYTSHPPDE